MKTLPGMLAALLLIAASGFAHAEMQRDLNEELKVLARGEALQLGIPGAKFRVAAFTYEDPDVTRLGDALATIVGREMLVRSKVPSIGVLRYTGGLAPDPDDSLSYFDKVEKVANAQKVVLSTWGMVRRSGSRLTVDTYVQIPPAMLEKIFVWRITLPKKMGSGELVGHLRPDRILAQRFEIPVAAGDEFIAAARKLNELRAQPDDAAAVVATLPKGSVYFLEKEQGDWIYMNAGAGGKGWVRRAGYCDNQCDGLIAAANFAAHMLAYMEKPDARELSGDLTPDAMIIKDQLEAYNFIDKGNYYGLHDISQRIDERLKESAQAGRVPPGGAGLANALAIDRVVELLWQEAGDLARRSGRRDVMAAYDQVAPDPARIREIAFELAEASLNDPNNVDVLHNLGVLFQYAGDEERAKLARTLATKKMVQ